MKPIIALNLQSTRETAEAANLPKTEGEKPKPVEGEKPVPAEVAKKLNRIANRAAHKAATDFDRSRSNLFSK